MLQWLSENELQGAIHKDTVALIKTVFINRGETVRTEALFHGLQPSVIWQSPNFLVSSANDGDDPHRGAVCTEMQIYQDSLAMAGHTTTL